MFKACPCLVLIGLLTGCATPAADPFAPLRARLDYAERVTASVAGEAGVDERSAVAGLTLCPLPHGHRPVVAGRGSESGGSLFAAAEQNSAYVSGGGRTNGTDAWLTSFADQPPLGAVPEHGEHPAHAAAGSETALSTPAAPARSPRRVPLPSFWKTVRRDVRAMPADLWKDTKAVYTSTPNLVILGLTYGGALALQETGPDNTVEDHFRNHTIFSKSSRDVFGALGNPGTHFALAGAWYLAGQQRQDEKTYSVGRSLFSALIITDLTALAGQALTWDQSPNGEWGTLPSGHTSSTFAVASVMHDAYGPWVGVPLYGLGVLVAMERLEDGEHYLADVVMGGVVGLVVGHSVAREHDFELFGGRIVPYADPNTGSTGIAWTKSFK